jgi:hypothetical protein
MVAVLGGTTRRMGLVDPAGIMEPKLPLTKLPESAEVALEDLQLAVRATVAISDHIAIRTEPPHLVFEGEGDTDTVTHRIPGVGSKMEVRSLFPLDYLSNFVSSLPAGSKLKLHLGQDYPIQVDFSWGDGAQTILGTYLLAPRIESE